MLRLAVQPLGFPERLRKVLEVVIAQAFVVDWQLCLWSERDARHVDVLVQLVGDRWPADMPIALPEHAPRLRAELRVGDGDQFRHPPFMIDRHSLFSQLVAALVAVGEAVRHPVRSDVAASRPAVASVPAAPANAPKTALVVEGSRQGRALIAAELVSMGFHAEAFALAEEALAFARTHAVALAVIETELEGPIDGIGLCRQLRETALEPISVLMLTSHGGTLERLRALVNGSHAYLVKPVDRHTFRTEVHRLLAAHEPEAERTH